MQQNRRNTYNKKKRKHMSIWEGGQNVKMLTTSFMVSFVPTKTRNKENANITKQK